jgi:HAD superfamily hydrolase (TIGR01509 family)
MNRIKAILFDMDGVLIDAKDWHYEALNRALRLFGLEINRYDHLVTYDGLPTKSKLERLSVERNLPRSLHLFINALKQQFTMELVHLRCKPIFAQQFAITQLKQMGYKLAVCSNSIRATMELMLQKSALFDSFEFYLSNQDVTLSKPHPEMYLKAITKSGFSAEECLIVEDNSNGIKAALDSGGHVMEVEGVEDVHFQNIMNAIQNIETSFQVGRPGRQAGRSFPQVHWKALEGQ